jgi:acyl-CoA hydrolase
MLLPLIVKLAALVAFIVKLFPVGITSVDVSVRVWFERAEAKTMMSPEAAVAIAFLKLPAPLSLLVVTVNVAEYPVVIMSKRMARLVIVFNVLRFYW